MSDQAQKSNQQMIVIALVVIVVLLAAIVGIVVFQNRPDVPALNSAAQQQAAPAADGSQAPAGAPAPAAVDPASVDAATATKLPKGVEPEAFVKSYYEACQKGDWQAAYDALPADKKQGQTPEGLEQQVSGYGVESFAVSSATVEGDQATVIADQVTSQYGTFENMWTFVKKDGSWYAATKAVTGMK